MVTSNQNGDHTKVLVRIKDDTIRELIVLTVGNNPALVRITGKIKPSDIQSVMNEHGNGC